MGTVKPPLVTRVTWGGLREGALLGLLPQHPRVPHLKGGVHGPVLGVVLGVVEVLELWGDGVAPGGAVLVLFLQLGRHVTELRAEAEEGPDEAVGPLEHVPLGGRGEVLGAAVPELGQEGQVVLLDTCQGVGRHEALTSGRSTGFHESTMETTCGSCTCQSRCSQICAS